MTVLGRSSDRTHPTSPSHVVPLVQVDSIIRKKLTSEDLTALLLHEQSRSISRLEHGMESMAEELRELRKEAIELTGFSP